MTDVVITVDSMVLCKYTIWHPTTKYYIGMVDYCTAIIEVKGNLAKEVLVFMVTHMSGHWKHQIAYVL